MTRAKIAAALQNAATARLVLAGKMHVGGCWTMPYCRSVVIDCWRQNMAIAQRELRNAP